MIIKNDTQRENLIEAGRRLGNLLEDLRGKVVSGISTEELDDFAESTIRDSGDEPAFLGYTPEGSTRAYPATLCVSINEEIVHGIPNESPTYLKEGDIVGLDLGLTHKGIIVDAAITVAVGIPSEKTKKLLYATQNALTAGIAAALPGNHIGDIGYAIQKEIIDAGFSVVKLLGGHGVGERVHEEPFVPNFGRRGAGEELFEGMVLALEPISSEGKNSILLAPDGYTYRTKDGSRSAHFEHTILIEKDGPLVVTQP